MGVGVMETSISGTIGATGVLDFSILPVAPHTRSGYLNS